LGVRDVSELRERVAQVAARLLLLFLRSTKLGEADQLFADQELAEAVVRHRSLGSHPRYMECKTWVCSIACSEGDATCVRRKRPSCAATSPKPRSSMVWPVRPKRRRG